MTDAALQGTYSDLKFVKTRKVVQMVVELPIEAGDRLVEIFGVPRPDDEVWVAVARIHSPSLREEKPPTLFHELSRTRQAGILCSDVKFQKWLGVETSTDAADKVRIICGVSSRCSLSSSGTVASKWDSLIFNYRTETGQQAEER
jgi:hypothetical protein